MKQSEWNLNKVDIDNVILSVAVLAQALTAFASIFGWWRWHKMLVRIGLGSWEQKIRVPSSRSCDISAYLVTDTGCTLSLSFSDMGNTHRMGSMAGMNNRENHLTLKSCYSCIASDAAPPLPTISMLWGPIDQEDSECFFLRGSPTAIKVNLKLLLPSIWLLLMSKLGP